MSDSLVETGAPPSRYSHVYWGAVIAGAITAASLASVLQGFAGAIGIAVSSAAPTWRDASIALWILSGVYLIAVALASYGLGGYVAGTLRSKLDGVDTEEMEVRDGIHGLLVWALATLLTVALIAAGALGISRLAAPSGGEAGPASSVAGENIIAYDIDKLFRGDRKGTESDIAIRRAEAARILLTSSGHAGVQPEDRSYLARLVSTHTGLAGPDVEKRVDVAVTSARQNIRRARASTVILAFMAGAAALIGAVAAWFGAVAGGQHHQRAWSTSMWRP